VKFKESKNIDITIHKSYLPSS